MCTDEAPVTLQIRLEKLPAVILEGLALKAFITGGVREGGDDTGGIDGSGDDGVNCGDDGDDGMDWDGVGDDGVNCDGVGVAGGVDGTGVSEAVVVPMVTVTDLVTLPEALVAVMV
jgi:hypothetical protein